MHSTNGIENMSDQQKALVLRSRAKFLRTCKPIVIKPLAPMHVAILRLQASR